ncbi:hypothetical protein D3C73_1256810 [compost metagenome]
MAEVQKVDRCHRTATVVVVGDEISVIRHPIPPPSHHGGNFRAAEHRGARFRCDHESVHMHGKQPVGGLLDAVLPGAGIGERDLVAMFCQH